MITAARAKVEKLTSGHIAMDKTGNNGHKIPNSERLFSIMIAKRKKEYI
ncbi:MAG TPA: hypothetical protein PLN24_03015 [Victivallales bacterium]|nr:hypothetical protein [Victivallales bacterium]